MTDTCDFDLERKNRIFFIGETVNGMATITIAERKTVEEIYVDFIGKAKIRFIEPDGPSNEEQLYKSDETFVVRRARFASKGLVPAGSYHRGFSFVIGDEGPTSAESNLGNVRYELSVLYVYPDRAVRLFQTPVTVIKPFNLNHHASYKDSPVVCESNIIKCCPVSCISVSCLSLEISFTLIIPFIAYAPGQKIRFLLDIHKYYVGRIRTCDVYLVKKMIFTCSRPKPKTKIALIPLDFKIYSDQEIADGRLEGELSIPSTPPTSFTDYQIRIQYYVLALMSFKCCSISKMKVEQTVIIGTVPLRESLAPNQRVRSNPAAPQVLERPQRQQRQPEVVERPSTSQRQQRQPEVIERPTSSQSPQRQPEVIEKPTSSQRPQRQPEVQHVASNEATAEDVPAKRRKEHQAVLQVEKMEVAEEESAESNEGEQKVMATAANMQCETHIELREIVQQAQASSSISVTQRDLEEENNKISDPNMLLQDTRILPPNFKEDRSCTVFKDPKQNSVTYRPFYPFYY